VSDRAKPQHLATVRVRFEATEPTAVVEVDQLTQAHAHDLGPALTAITAHVLRWHDCRRIVTFVDASDDDLQRQWERAGLRAVAVDGDELVFVARTP